MELNPEDIGYVIMYGILGIGLLVWTALIVKILRKWKAPTKSPEIEVNRLSLVIVTLFGIVVIIKFPLSRITNWIDLSGDFLAICLYITIAVIVLIWLYKSRKTLFPSKKQKIE